MKKNGQTFKYLLTGIGFALAAAASAKQYRAQQRMIKLNQILEIIPKKSKNELTKMLQQSVKFDYDKKIVIAIESALNALKTRDLAVNDALVVMSEGDK